MHSIVGLTRGDLAEVADAVLLANTPASLLGAIRRSAAVQCLASELGPMALSEYYDKITARHRRSAIVLGLAYAALVAAFSRGETIDVDASRLRWGETIRELMSATLGVTNQGIILTATNQATPAKVSPHIEVRPDALARKGAK